MDVDALFSQRLEHFLRHAGITAHTNAYDRDLHHCLIGKQILEGQVVSITLDHRDGAIKIAFGDGESDVSFSVKVMF